MKLSRDRSLVVSFSVLSALFGHAASAAYNGPPGGPTSAAENEAIFKQYCVGDPSSAEIPKVNYSNPEVQEAIQRMASVKDKNYYFYSPVLRVYGLGKNSALTPPPADAPKELTPGGHAFLVQLCGEFRDRATLIQERIQWLRKLHKLPVTIPTAYDPKGDPWAQMSAHWYQPYLQLSSAYYYAKIQEATKTGKHVVTIGKHKDEDAPTNGVDGCETKYMFSEYVSKTKAWDNLADFLAGYETFKAQHCTAEDVTFYYDFRGDKNFKHNSPEGNAMIWTASSITSQCSTPATAKAGSPLSDEDCVKYFKSPFLSRWKGARAGLATWLMRDSKYNAQFETQNGTLTMLFNAKDFSKPFPFLMKGVEDASGTPIVIDGMLPEYLALNDPMSRGDLGFNDVTGQSVFASPNWNMELQFERLRDAVNTHTNWYGSGYDDKLPGGMKQTQFYSPFVASSYEMSASDGFATEQSGNRKAWMFIFKVKKENWYNSQSVLDRKPVDFDTMWLDETTLGTQGYAEHERAFDRLGTSIEGEHAAILYLHNIYQGQVISDEILDDEVQAQLEELQKQLKPGIEIKKSDIPANDGTSLKLEFQGNPECWNEPQPDGSIKQECYFTPEPVWLTVANPALTDTSVVEATISFQYPAQPGQPAQPPQVQKFALKRDAAAGGFRGFALGWGGDAYRAEVSLAVKVDGKPVTFGPGPIFDEKSVVDFKALVPPPPAPPAPSPVPVPSPIPVPAPSPVPVP
jgi:hypothetical protein